MKICKVTLNKCFSINATSTRCDNHYPEGYKARQPGSVEGVQVVSYSEDALTEGDNIGYLIGTVPDNFEFTDDMVEITKAEAEAFIDIVAAMGKTQELVDRYKGRKAYLV